MHNHRARQKLRKHMQHDIFYAWRPLKRKFGNGLVAVECLVRASAEICVTLSTKIAIDYRRLKRKESRAVSNGNNIGIVFQQSAEFFLNYESIEAFSPIRIMQYPGRLVPKARSEIVFNNALGSKDNQDSSNNWIYETLHY